MGRRPLPPLYSTGDAALGTLPEPDKLAEVPTFTAEHGGPKCPPGSDGDPALAPSSAAIVAAGSGVAPLNALSVAVPTKLAQKILRLEYVEMTELIPETWGLEPDNTSSCCHQGHRQTRRGPVVDILVWLECYSSLVAVLATRFPGHVGDFMAYQRTIIRASKNFEGTAWAIYDRCYRRRAAAVKSLNWANIDSALYNEAFTGRARAIPRCRVCLSENHREAECPDRSLPIPGHPGGGHDGNYVPQRSPYQPYYGRQQTRAGQPVSQEVCQLFNRAQCRAVWCRRRHTCNQCGLPHPEVACTARAREGHRPRSPHRKGPRLA